MISQAFDIAIVISSYNREDKILKTVDSIFNSDLSGFNAVELIIIDDGSPKPVENLMSSFGELPSCITMRLLKQKNAGIGATRNRGFREARSPVVLFLDDDIILYKDTIKKIFRAQRESGSPVIFGCYPFISHQSPTLENFARHLFNYDGITTEPAYQKVDAITSGLLCVNKVKLDIKENFYRDDLTVPAAEEHEIIARFNRQNIPIYNASHIVAIHNHHLKLEWLIIQQYKYGLGTAEVFLKYPDITKMERYAGLKTKLDAIGGISFKSLAKTAITSIPGRKILFFYARTLERISPKRNHNFIFGLLTSAYYWAGYRDGLRKFNMGKA